MNLDLIDKFLFRENAKKKSLIEKTPLYLSVSFFLIAALYCIKDIFILFFQNNYLISVICLSIYVLYGIKKNIWIKGVQGFLLSIIFISVFLGTLLQENQYFLELKQYSEFHHTRIGSDLWINLKVKDDNTYEIQIASPSDGVWSEIKKGNISSLKKQRYTDTGQEYYSFYLENYPFVNERTMVAFENAFSIAELKFNNDHYLLSDGSARNPWK